MFNIKSFIMVEKFKEYLTHSNMAKNTVAAYI